MREPGVPMMDTVVRLVQKGESNEPAEQAL